jgi:A/G-specific adenine glycosylase
MDNRDFFVNKLIQWGETNLIDYPWRKFNDPYKSLITEVLLKKTNAEKVKNIIEETLEVIPDLERLESLPQDMLELILEPYGMSRIRAEQLKEIAYQLRNDFYGKIPQNEEALLKLYGVGPYIARALLSFVFDKPYGIIDTNVIRLVERYFGYVSSHKRARNDKDLLKFIDSLVPNETYKVFNYSLLDYPKMICKVRTPLCNTCMLNEQCIYSGGIKMR